MKRSTEEYHGDEYTAIIIIKNQTRRFPGGGTGRHLTLFWKQ